MQNTQIWEETVMIPTYQVGKPDRNPLFLEKRVYQGSSGKIYPYPATWEISREKKDMPWKAVFLENEYLKIMILPELGGRIQRAYDKTNDYDFVYYNHVIKPALVGLLGPWISGGIEFNWPQHHRPTTFMPVQYQLRENPDGSVTVLLGDTDQIYGTKVVTSISLHPGKSYIEVKGQLYNGTALPQTFLWWANPAVSVNDYTQSIFPPDVHFVYDHGKRDVSRFPIATGEYYKHDYSQGVDISRYKNIPVPTSYMAEPSAYNFVGGYDYKKEAGLLHVADHHVSPGKKQWTWGNGDFGKAWDRNLTDQDGPYIELMTGMYCENQPDFTWLKPYEEKVFYQYFMPYKKVGQVKNASTEAVLNVQLREEGLYVCAYGTEDFHKASIRIYEGDKEIYREACSLSPNDIYEKTLPFYTGEKVDSGNPVIKDRYSLRVAVYDGDRELVSYQEKQESIPRTASPAKAPLPPEEMLTNEELYLTGMHIEQYRHATWLPETYYLEGLKRDPKDIRINTAYGLLLVRRGQFAQSEQYFKTAIDRLTGNGTYNNPYDSEAFYDLGLAQFYQGKLDLAYDNFYKATWSKEQQEMSFYYLAAIETERGNYGHALSLIEQGLVKNAHNIKARVLKAVLLFKLGRKEETLGWIEDNISLDLFDYVSILTKYLTRDDVENGQEYIRKMSGNSPETALSMARDLMEAGLYQEALLALDVYKGSSPMIYYYRAYCLGKLGQAEKQEENLSKAEAADSYCCFPNKLEDIGVLLAAITGNPKGAKAFYYLGNLYYDKLQYDLAIEMWTKSAKLDASFPTCLRNLAIALYNKQSDKESALKYLEAAFAQDDTDARVLLELDQLYKVLQYSPEQRLSNFEKNISIVTKRDDLYTEYITVLNLCGKFKEAYQAIMSHHFATWEGAEGKISGQYKICLLEMAKEAFYQKQLDVAEKYIRQALIYPENLGEGKLEGTKDNNLYYYLGLIMEAKDVLEEAREYYRKAGLGAVEPAGVMYYYDQPADMILFQGKAFEKLGDQAKANARYYALINYGQLHLEEEFKMDYFAVSMPDFAIFEEDMTLKNRLHCYYLMGLGYLGLGEKTRAEGFFKQVLEADCAHQKALIYLKEIEAF